MFNASLLSPPPLPDAMRARAEAKTPALWAGCSSSFPSAPKPAARISFSISLFSLSKPTHHLGSLSIICCPRRMLAPVTLYSGFDAMPAPTNANCGFTAANSVNAMTAFSTLMLATYPLMNANCSSDFILGIRAPMFCNSVVVWNCGRLLYLTAPERISSSRCFMDSGSF